MNLYYSTCPTGLEKVIAKLAAPAIRGFSISKILPGALIYSAGGTSVPRCGGFLNTYLIMDQIPRSRHVVFAGQRFASDLKLMHEVDQTLSHRRLRSYRVMFMEDRSLTTVKSDLRSQLERPIRSAKVNRETPETELVVLQRPEGSAYLLLRLTHGENTRHQLQPGELPAQLAWCMNAMARPRRGGVFLDPFAGSGALALARTQFAPPETLMSFDLDGEKVRQARKRLPDIACVEKVDAFRLDERLQRASVTELVTDPVDATNAERKPTQYYLDMLRQFAWVLAPGGHLVALVQDSAHFESALKLLSEELFARERVDFLAGSRHLFIYQCIRKSPKRPERDWEDELQ